MNNKLPARRIDSRAVALEAFSRFLSSSRSKLSAETRRKYAGFVILFVSFLKDANLRLEEVTKNHIDLFQKALMRKARANEAWRENARDAYSASTRNLVASSVATFFKVCNREGLTDFYPEMTRIRLEAPEIEHLYAREVAYFREYLSEQVLAEQNPNKLLALLRIRAAILGYLGTGARISELLGVRWSDLRKHQTEKGKHFWSVVLEGKGNKRRRVTISGSAVRALQEYRHFQTDYFWRRWRVRIQSDDHVFLRDAERVVTDRGLRKAIERAYREARKDALAKGIRFHLSSIHPHLFRHTVGTQMRTAGADLVSIQTQLGHSSSDTTSKYYVHRSLESVADAISRMDRNLSRDNKKTPADR